MAKTNSILERAMKASKINGTAILKNSEFFGNVDPIQSAVYAMNIAMDGDLDGGITPGLHMIAGASKSFKTAMGLVWLRAYLDSDKSAIALFFDTEYGAMPPYFEACGIDTSRVLHIPLTNMEELKFELINQLEQINRGDKVFLFVDSVGNIASIKELDDAKEEKGTQDMTRAKQFKSIYRMITPILIKKSLTMLVINHTYMEQGQKYPKNVVSGGTGGIYSSNNIWIITKEQIKEDGELLGFDFKINIEKSRTVKEKSQIALTVEFDGGINKYSGLFDLGVELNYIKSPTKGRYERVLFDKITGEVIEDKSWWRKDTNCAEFWEPIFETTDFKKKVREHFRLPVTGLVNKDG